MERARIVPVSCLFRSDVIEGVYESSRAQRKAVRAHEMTLESLTEVYFPLSSGRVVLKGTRLMVRGLFGLQPA